MNTVKPDCLSEVNDITALVSAIESHCEKAHQYVAEMQQMYNIRHTLLTNIDEYEKSIDELRDKKDSAIRLYLDTEKKLKICRELSKQPEQRVLHSESVALLESYEQEVECGYATIDRIYGAY